MWRIQWSEWLHKVNEWNWAHLDNVFSSIVGATVLAGIVWAAIKFIWNPLFDHLTRRRAQAKVLDQLVCGSSVAFVESLLGVAQFASREDGREQRIYRLRGGWVLIEIEDGAVLAFSITISNRRLHYRTKHLTFGFLNVKLGKSKFRNRGRDFSGERCWIGGRTVGYQRHYYLGNPGGYQDYWLSYNMSGAGGITLPDAEGGISRASGTLRVDGSDSPSDPINASGITVNTLTVLGLSGSRDEFFARHTLGPEETILRLAQNIKHPNRQTRWQALKIKCTLLRYRLAKALRAIKCD